MVTTKSVLMRDARMTSLVAAADALFRRVYDSLGALVAAAFFLYAGVVVVGVVRDAAAPPGHSGGRRCRGSPSGTPDDVRSVTIRPSTAVTPRCSAVATVGRTFSETKV